MKPQSVVVLSLVAALLAAAAVVLYPRVSGHPIVDLKTPEISNVKQVALGAAIYATDYDDVLPGVQDQTTFQSVILPYVKNATLFQDDPAHQTHIAFNTHLSNVKQTVFSNPADVVCVTTPRAPTSTAPIDKYFAAFADTHAKVFTIKTWNADYRDRLDWNFPRASDIFLPPAKP